MTKYEWTTGKWTKCDRCTQMGYFSPKFSAVLCNRHFFEANSKTGDNADAMSAKIEVAPTSWPTTG